MRTAPHVLHVVTGLAPGGLELAMCRIIASLQAGGIRHSICYLAGEPGIAACLPPCVPLYGMQASPHELLLPLRLRRLIREIQPSVIHARNWGAWPDVAVARLLTLSPVPLVFSFHGLPSAGPMPWRRRVAFRALASVTSHIFTVSQASRELLSRQAWLPIRRIGLIPNGVDTDQFSPGPRRPESQPIRIGTVGNLIPVKNQRLLLLAFAQASSSAAVPMQLRLAGEGPLRPELERLVGELRLEKQVEFMGHVRDIPSYLRELDVFVMSSASEAHPNALLEAMACGLPCVATDVGGVREALDAGRCGTLVPPGETSALAAALLGLVGDVDERHRLGARARARACGAYSLARMADAYERMYMRLAGCEPAAGKSVLRRPDSQGEEIH